MLAVCKIARASTEASALCTRYKLDPKGQKQEHINNYPQPTNPGKCYNLTHELERKDSKKC